MLSVRASVIVASRDLSPHNFPVTSHDIRCTFLRSQPRRIVVSLATAAEMDHHAKYRREVARKIVLDKNHWNCPRNRRLGTLFLDNWLVERAAGSGKDLSRGRSSHITTECALTV